jgi:hypothetical protein
VYKRQIFYLAEVLQEDLDGRRQGARVEAEWSWYKGGSGEDATYETSYAARAEFVHNLSLALQVGAHVAGSWRTVNGPLDDYHGSGAEAGGEMLWTIADRLRLDGRLTAAIQDTDPERLDLYRRQALVVAELALRVRVEDRLALRPIAGLRWTEEKAEGAWASDGRIWAWYYGIGLEYRLDDLLF